MSICSQYAAHQNSTRDGWFRVLLQSGACFLFRSYLTTPHSVIVSRLSLVSFVQPHLFRDLSAIFTLSNCTMLGVVIASGHCPFDFHPSRYQVLLRPSLRNKFLCSENQKLFIAVHFPHTLRYAPVSSPVRHPRFLSHGNLGS
ncbi:hypothetical protein CRM22_002053 [Opisthorchis felineus]|uniref:Uncharacterized protein n=1 Tax=Opisthorchis felineus TaxID=147828 RepID=A0A4S2M800_OPIFE|nr:hypothetical protein CRM22_002053 [Opisthorchis felineus]